MDIVTKNKLETNLKSINHDLQTIIDEQLPTYDTIKLQFKCIRILIDECEELALQEYNCKSKGNL